MIGDAVVVWRTWVLWNGTWPLIFPLLIWFGSLGKRYPDTLVTYLPWDSVLYNTPRMQHRRTHCRHDLRRSCSPSSQRRISNRTNPINSRTRSLRHMQRRLYLYDWLSGLVRLFLYSCLFCTESADFGMSCLFAFTVIY